MAENGRFKSRLGRIETAMNRAGNLSDPSAIAILDNGERIALLRNGEWVSWPADAPTPKVCKFYGFDPRGAENGRKRQTKRR
jgi:hypothetical protein